MADGLQDEALQYVFQYFFIVYGELDFPAGMCRIEKGENEKVRHAIENVERKSWGWGREWKCVVYSRERGGDHVQGLIG